MFKIKNNTAANYNTDDKFAYIDFASVTKVTIYTSSSQYGGSISTNVCNKLKIHNGLSDDPKDSVISVFYNNSIYQKVITYIPAPIGADINITIDYDKHYDGIDIWIEV